MRSRNTDKERLVKETAIEMLVAEGVERFSMNRLAKACGISVATLYIYYKDKDDLITSIALEEARDMVAATLQGFDPDASMREGLHCQWQNRVAYLRAKPCYNDFYEMIRNSSYRAPVEAYVSETFREPLGRFMHGCLARGELRPLTFETYWAIAFGTLYMMARFSQVGFKHRQPFELTDAIVWEAFDAVIAALTPPSPATSHSQAQRIAQPFCN